MTKNDFCNLPPNWTARRPSDNAKRFYQKYADVHPFVCTLGSHEMSTDDYKAIIELLTLGVISVVIGSESSEDGNIDTYAIRKIKDFP